MRESNPVQEGDIETVSKKLNDASFQNVLRRLGNKKSVFVIGLSGSGKSTLINYCRGSRYRRQGISGFNETLAYCGGIPEEAVVSVNRFDSQTLVPSVHFLDNRNYVLCDLSGFGETRGKLAEIVGSLMAQILVKTAQVSPQIIFTLDCASIISSRGSRLTEYFGLFGKIMGTVTPQKMASVVIALTKFPVGITAEQFIADYIEPKARELRSRSTPLSPKEQATLDVCSYLILNRDSVVITDPSDEGESAKKLLTQLDRNISSVLDLDLISQEASAQLFVSELMAHVSDFNQRYKHVSQFAEREEQRQREIRDICTEMAYLEDQPEVEKSVNERRNSQNEQNKQEGLRKVGELQCALSELLDRQAKLSERHHELQRLSAEISVGSVFGVRFKLRSPEMTLVTPILNTHVRTAQLEIVAQQLEKIKEQRAKTQTALSVMRDQLERIEGRAIEIAVERMRIIEETRKAQLIMQQKQIEIESLEALSSIDFKNCWSIRKTLLSSLTEFQCSADLLVKLGKSDVDFSLFHQDVQDFQIITTGYVDIAQNRTKQLCK